MGELWKKYNKNKGDVSNIQAVFRTPLKKYKLDSTPNVVILSKY